MEITHSTVPGVGVLHQCTTRSGQVFEVLVDRIEGRELIAYGPSDDDEPASTIVLDQEEADHLAELLHSRSIADRMADLERRLLEIAGRAP